MSSDDKYKQSTAARVADQMLRIGIITESSFDDQVKIFSGWPEETLKKIEAFLQKKPADKFEATLKIGNESITLNAEELKIQENPKKLEFMTVKFDSDGNIISKLPAMSRREEGEFLERFKQALKEQQAEYYGASVEDGEYIKKLEIPEHISNLIKDASKKAEFINEDELMDYLSLKDLQVKLADKKPYTTKNIVDGKSVKRTLNWESDEEWFKNQYPGTFMRSDDGVAKTSDEAVAGIAIKPGEPSQYVVVGNEKKREVKLTPDKMQEQSSVAKTTSTNRGSLKDVNLENKEKKTKQLENDIAKSLKKPIIESKKVEYLKNTYPVSNGNKLTDILESDDDFKDLLKDYSFLDEQKNTTNLLEKFEEKIVEATRAELRAKRELFLLNRALEASYAAAEKEPVTLELPKPVELKPTSDQLIETFKEIAEGVLGKEYHSGDDCDRIYAKETRLRNRSSK